MSGAANPHLLLLRDLDGDGFADALLGPAWLSTAALDAAVAAGADLIGVLAARALALPIDAREWQAGVPALYLGLVPPPGPLPVTCSGLPEETRAALPAGACVHLSGDGLLLSAPDGEALRTVGRVLARSWTDGVPGTEGVVGRAWAARAAVHAPHAGEQDERAGEQRLGAAALGDPKPINAGGVDAGQRLSLGSALSGGVLYSGEPEFPARFLGGFHADAGVAGALEVAARLATEGLQPAVDLAGGPEGAVRAGLDTDLHAGRWELRAGVGAAHGRLEIVGGDAVALAAGSRYFARGFPRLADGTRLDDLERDLERFLRLDTRDGRLAAVAVATAPEPVRYELPYPPADAPLRLGAPVCNSARDGAARRWTLEAAWEGDRLLMAADGMDVPDEPYTAEAYASETLAVRRRLADALRTRLAARGRSPDAVVVRHAHKPALHWLVEEVAPALPATTHRLEVDVGRQEEGSGAPVRWLRELYPAAELLERERRGLDVVLALDDADGPPRYRARALDADGAELRRFQLAPPVALSPKASGGEALVTTGGLRLTVGGRPLRDLRVPTDREVAWSFLAGDVFPALVEAAEGEPPFLHEIAVVVAASEPDERLGLDHETDSVLEGLHEDIYFGLLEAFAAARPEDTPRRLAPSRILPFCRQAVGEPTRVKVVARAHGTGSVAAVGAGGVRVEAAPLHARAVAAVLAGQADAPDTLAVEVVGPDARAALERLTWGAERGLLPFPRGIELHLRAGSVRRRVAAIQLRPAEEEALPDRPLHPREVVAHVRDLAARDPRVRLRLAHESVLGQPLACLEVASPAGPGASRARQARWRPSVLISARQHANEPTSTQAVLDLLARELGRPRLSKPVNLVVHPLENPDGARLHAALCSLAPNHMHHAARYTAYGADLQADPVLDGRLIGESAQRHDAWRRWKPTVHLNNHGYPAHEWVRPQTGYLPAGFENWSLPVGHLTILELYAAVEDEGAALLGALRRRVAAALAAAPDVAGRSQEQMRRSRRYRPAGATPFRVEAGLPFWQKAGPRKPGRDEVFRPDLVVITEVPDETVDGVLWDACVAAHRIIDETVLTALGEALGGVGTAEREAGQDIIARLQAWARTSR